MLKGEISNSEDMMNIKYKKYKKITVRLNNQCWHKTFAVIPPFQAGKKIALNFHISMTKVFFCS